MAENETKDEGGKKTKKKKSGWSKFGEAVAAVFTTVTSSPAFQDLMKAHGEALLIKARTAGEIAKASTDVLKMRASVEMAQAQAELRKLELLTPAMAVEAETARIEAETKRAVAGLKLFRAEQELSNAKAAPQVNGAGGEQRSAQHQM